MNIEKLNLNKITSKGIVIGIVIGVSIIIILNLLTSRAKYQVTESVNIAKGEIKYSASDLDIVAMYKIENGEDKPIEEVPGEGYILNNKTNCKVKDVIDETIEIKYENNKLSINGITKKGTKCHIYFEKQLTAEDTLAKLKLKSKACENTFSEIAETDETKEGLCEVEDGMYGGTSYYFRGAVANNYVHFANAYWRIIRINGDGTLRLIYDGDQAYDNGVSNVNRQIGTKAYNTDYDVRKYVGFKYDDGEHGSTSPSTILGNNAGTENGTLNWWYKTNIADKNLEDKVDQNGLFCNDRNATINESQTWDEWVKKKADSTGSSTYYGAYMRFYNKSSVTPTLNCENPSDIFSKENSAKGNESLTYPIGLITADEVILAGGFGYKINNKYYLYTGQDFWTMSPLYFYSSYANVFYVYSFSSIDGRSVNSTLGVRPVINIKADKVQIGSGSGDPGTTGNPYIVS